MVVEDHGDGFRVGEDGDVEEVVVGEAWAAVEYDERCDGGFEITEYAVVCLKGFVYGGVDEWDEAIVRAFEGSCGHGGVMWQMIKGMSVKL